ncbi:P1 family peptidase [Salimicrobium salexigens]|uniref:L-aminopeptidase/D-esterase n=1 Tax=Salimicrobium salexigens TaxID=908941 RepID=A0ABY1KQQ4_9BACI|nr:P1 family peptidase [Salimicrobium salexigens]SIS66026.1 L-aminopeptidase/D-esterase [Salimicrobium salexigens]
MKSIDIREVTPFLYGHCTDEENGTGTTVIIHETGAVGGVSVQGRAPGTRETDLLKSENTVQNIHAVTLSGGSAFGLEAAGGVMNYLSERKIGFELLGNTIPIVPGAILFDFLPFSGDAWPDSSYGYEAAHQAFHRGNFASGNAGAGTGAAVGKMKGYDSAMKGGFGSCAVEVNGLKVGACIAVNAFGDIIDPETGRIIAGARENGSFLDTAKSIREMDPPDGAGGMNTTIGCITTNANITKSEANHIASAAHDGLARCIRPVHTVMDGDALFVMAGGEVDVSLLQLSALAVHVVEQAVLTAVRKATGAYQLPAFQDLFKQE